MRSTNQNGCHRPAFGRDASPAFVAPERAAMPAADLAAAWLVKRHRVKPHLAATVALHAGLGERRRG